MSRALSLLVVDDDASIRRIFRDILAPREDVEIQEAAGAEQALALLRSGTFDAAFVDVRMPGLGGMELLQRVKRERPSIEIVMVTAHGTIESAVEAMRLGAADYLPKPFKLDQVSLILGRLRRVRRLQSENEQLRRQLEERYSPRNLVGLSSPMRRCAEIIDRVRREDCNVLLLGESGTGKELLARSIHYDGTRHERLFVPIDCGAIAPSLLESELFGHERGAFTGAHTRKAGLFEIATGGTVFLDEVGEIPLELQPALLRAIETKEIRPVGATSYRAVDVRILAATNRPLERMVAEGRFRRDLYYRLNTVTVPIPPLRDRRDDIPLLVDHFLRDFAAKGSRAVTGLSRDALRALEIYDWPGNVRELRHAIERACALGRGEEIGVDDLPPDVLRDPGTQEDGPVRSIADMEREALEKLLRQYEGDTARAAQILGIDRSTLYRKVKRWGLRIKKS
ncbi:MAG TPA: sigma-54 dependent transcriptional regulator [Planctomycetota bacterium]